MIKRTIDVSSGPARLSLRHRQLLIERDDQPSATIPVEDIGFLLIDHPAISYTHGLMVALAEAGAVVALSDQRHLPAALCIPAVGNTVQAERQRAQIATSRPLLKQLWRRIIAGKIAHQADTLDSINAADPGLRAMAARVRSGDPENLEAQAAIRYWPRLFGKAFRRDPDGDAPNHVLNYGYAIVRACAVRAIVGAGLLPAFGVQHSNRANPFALADDLIEPYRPFVDRVAVDMQFAGLADGDLDRQRKAHLLGLLNRRVEIVGKTTPLALSFHAVAASLVESYRDGAVRLALPTRLLTEAEERELTGLQTEDATDGATTHSGPDRVA